MDIPEWLDAWIEHIPFENQFYGNSVQRWLTALAVFVLALFVIRIVKAFLSLRARSIARKTENEWAGAIVALIDATRVWFRLVLALYIGSLVLDFSANPLTRDVIESVASVTLLLQAGVWGNVLLTFIISRYVREKMEADASAVTTISAMGFVGKLALWAVVSMLALQNLGVEVTALVAGLGVGGIAVALAAQNILGDLFASLSIVLDKPFMLGDFIIVDDKMGTVENIGLKTTRVRSLFGEQLVFSNTDLLQSRIRNYKRMQERRIVFGVGVTYGTAPEKLRRVPEIIRETIESQQQTRFDRVHLKAFGDFSLNYEAVYYVLSPDYNLYMDIQQAINLAVYERFAEEGIEFAFPTQTVFVNQ